MGFGSLEAALTTTADVATDCISWWTWTSRCRAAGIINGGLSGRLYKSTKQSGRDVSKRCINSNVCKDSYNEAIENGYTTSEALLLLELAVAMWKATKYASYILGDYE
jgi:hypothetical protein